jgi:hypothetical protein
MSKVTPEMLAKLPKWAQEHIKDLSNEREMALRTLNDYTDNQTPSKIYWDDFVCLGETTGPSTKRSYVQTERIIVESCGVQLTVSCHGESVQHDPGIELQWSDAHRIGNMIAAVPRSYMQMSLIAHHNMRNHLTGIKHCAHTWSQDGHCLKCGLRPKP